SVSIQETKMKGAILPSQPCQNTTFWCSIIYYFLAVKVMLLADCSSQHKKILSNNILIQLTVQQK
ncbi:hypothetical protein DSO51_08025, partial [Salmonella enterica]|nr:hypothetical protein [Salmonella enterica]